jgi:hypothetical protein
MTNTQIKAMMNSPQKLMKFHLTGKPPMERRAPLTPLLALINTIPLREWHLYIGVKVDRNLGFNGSRQFNSLHQVARWLGRGATLIDNQKMPYQSYSLRGFNKKLTIDDLNAQCSKHPLDFESQ